MKYDSTGPGKYISSFLRVSRWQIQLVSFASVLIGPLFASNSVDDIISLDVLLFGVLFYSVVTFACNFNCYHDVEVDSLRKIYLAHSVKHLGKKLVSAMILEVFVAVSAIIMLALRGHLLVSILGLTGLLLAYTYSAPSTRVKSKGIVSPLPVILGVYVLPPLAGHMIIDVNISLYFGFFVIGYALLNLGINLLNIAEDHSVDMQTDIRTVSHAMGLEMTAFMSLSTYVVGAMTVIYVFVIMLEVIWPAMIVFSLCIITISSVGFDISTIFTGKISLENAIQNKAGRLPIYFVVTRYPMVLFLLVLLMI